MLQPGSTPAVSKAAASDDFPFEAWPYYASFLVPALIIAGCKYGGVWAWATFILAFVIIPVLDLVVKPDELNPTKEQEIVRMVSRKRLVCARGVVALFLGVTFGVRLILLCWSLLGFFFK